MNADDALLLSIMMERAGGDVYFEFIFKEHGPDVVLSTLKYWSKEYSNEFASNVLTYYSNALLSKVS